MDHDLDELIAADRRSGYRGHGEQALWHGVVMQALADLTGQPVGSSDYDEAVAFFTRSGTWGEARASVADCVGVHADDLERGGRRVIAQRERGGGGLRARRAFIEQQLAK